MIAHLNKYGMCLEPNMKYPILDDIGQQFIDRAAELVKSGHKFVYEFYLEFIMPHRRTSNCYTLIYYIFIQSPYCIYIVIITSKTIELLTLILY